MLDQGTKRKEKYNRVVFNALLAVGITTLLFVWIFSITKGVFTSNDDVVKKAIASGELTGEPDAHLIYINYFLGLIIKIGYQIWPTAPVYGIVLYGIAFGALLFIIYRILKQAQTVFVKIVICAVFMLFCYYLLLLHFALIQFTTVAALSGAAALFWLFTSDYECGYKQSIIKNIPAFLLLACAYMLRSEVFLLLCPMAVLFFAVNVYRGTKEERKSKWKYFLLQGVAVVAIISALFLINTVAYSSADWKEYREYNDARTTVNDYFEFPKYEENKEIYDKYHISYASYMGAWKHHFIVCNDAINVESLTELGKASVADYYKDVTLGERFVRVGKNFIERMISYTDRPLNLFVYLLYGVTLVFSVLHKNKRAIFEEIAILLGSLLIWFYLFWIERAPDRVTQGLYLIQLFSLGAILLREKLTVGRTKYMAWLVVMCFIAFCSRFASSKVYNARMEVISRSDFSMAYSEIKDYFVTNSDKFYLVDVASIGNYTEDSLANQDYGYLNYMLLGSWLTHSPLYNQKLQREQISDIEKAVVTDAHVYLFSMETEGIDYIVDYYKEKYPDSYFTLEDEWTTTNGIKYGVWKGHESLE